MFGFLMYLGGFMSFVIGILLGSAFARAITGDAVPAASSDWTSFDPAFATSATVVWSKTSTSVIPQPSHCGEYGNFTLDWDDVPIFNPTDDNGEFLFPPVFNPYHQLFFSNGYAYAPPPNTPFKPVSPPHLAVFLPNSTTQDIGSPSAAGARPGEIGAGPRAASNAFWFNAYGAYLGCDNGRPAKCNMTVKGFIYDESQEAEVLIAEKHFVAAPCIGIEDCRLQYYRFGFLGLSGLQIGAWAHGKARIFFMDNLRMGWYNNTCQAGLLRQMSRK